MEFKPSLGVQDPGDLPDSMTRAERVRLVEYANAHRLRVQRLNAADIADEQHCQRCASESESGYERPCLVPGDASFCDPLCINW